MEKNYNFEGEVVQIIVQKDYKTTDLKKYIIIFSQSLFIKFPFHLKKLRSILFMKKHQST